MRRSAPSLLQPLRLTILGLALAVSAGVSPRGIGQLGVGQLGAGQLGTPPSQPPAPQPTAPQPAPESFAVPTVAGEAGPLLALPPVVARLGGTLTAQAGGSYSLELADRRVLFGPDSGAAALGTDLITLSESPRLVGGTVYVPLDFLTATYGQLAGLRLRWDAASGRLEAVRRRGRTLQVTSDVVHLQGITTVVFQFPETPRYRISQGAGRVEVEVADDTLVAAPRRPVDQPLVDSIEIGEQRIVLRLAVGAEADSYTLDNPFRLVFDVHPGTGGGEPPPTLEPPERPEGIRTIVVDPGHGGSESGAVGPSGVAEKELTLRLARALAARLEATLGVRVVLTRDEDANLPLKTRTAIANQNKADLFVSIHLNSALGSTARGAETYFLSSTASDERAARSAAAENRPGATAAGEPGDDALYELQLMLWDLAQSHFLSQSQRLATLIQGELNSQLELRDRGVKQAPFVVLMGAAMPAVLVELGFLSNPEEEKRLQDPEYRADLVAALSRAIGRYKAQVEGTPPAATAPAEPAAAGADEGSGATPPAAAAAGPAASPSPGDGA